MKVETPPITFAVDEARSGAVLGADRDGSAAEVEVLVAGAPVCAVEDQDRVAIGRGVDALLDGVEGVLRRAVLQRVADRRVTGAGIVRRVVVDVPRRLASRAPDIVTRTMRRVCLNMTLPP